jgi:Arc/MetJ family transcription regulator
VTPKRTERQIDDALLATAVWAWFLYVRRRTRRLLSRAALAATVTAGLGALGAAGLVAAWQRNRTQRS